MSLKIQTLDRKIWRKDLINEYLLKCHQTNSNAILDFNPEGSCAESLGIYRLLDEFCLRTGYAKNKITIITANMLEQHDNYNIIKNASYWYEIISIQQWLHDKNINISNNPIKHFANFTSRSNWARLWIATILNKNYSDKTLQTYHYDPLRENYNFNGYIGLDDLVTYGCDIVTDAVLFIQNCPYVLDLDYLNNLDNCNNSIFQHENSYYPIQHPSNLNLVQYYNNIFVDVVVEPNVSGNCFLVTEKLWRCIIAKRPFIVMSNTNYLSNLQRLGFKTFDKWWSELYDYSGMQHRIINIAHLLNIISQWDINTLSEILNDMQEVLNHNYNNFLTLTYSELSKEFI